MSTESLPPQSGTHGFGLASVDLVPFIVAAAAIASGLSGQEPTGNAGADFALSALFGGGLVQLSQTAKRHTLEIASVLGLFFTALAMPWAAIGLVALASSLMINRYWKLDRDSWLIGAAITAALLSQVLLNLPSIRWVGTASLMAAVAAAPIVASGLAGLSPMHRHRTILATIALSFFAAFAAAFALWGALTVRASVETGVDQAEQGLRALENGDQPTALALLDASEENFANATGRLRGPMSWASRVVPVVAQHSRALETTATQGERLVRTAARTVRSADLDSIRGVNGTIDLAQVAAVNVELASANDVLVDAYNSVRAVRTPWVLPLLDNRLADVEAELITTGQDTQVALLATDVLPDLLGADGLRRYLILFVQPAESREFGGFVGAYGILEANAGRLDLIESGSIDDDLVLSGFAEAQLTGEFEEAFVRIAPGTYPQNITSVPDLDSIARGAAELMPQWRRNPSYTIDGVITMDPYAVAGLLELVGPVSIESRDQPLNAANVTDFLLRDQYYEFDDLGRDARQDALTELAGAAFDRLLTIELPGPGRISEVFGPLARANRIAMSTYDPLENVFFDQVDLSANMPQVGTAVDFFGTYTSTAFASKLDAYLELEQTIIIEPNPTTGEVNTSIAATLINAVTPDAPAYAIGPNGGDNQVVVSMYSRAELAGLMGSDPTIPTAAIDAFGYRRFTVITDVPRQQSVTLTATAQSTMLDTRHDVFVAAQPAANIGQVTIIVRPVPGWSVLGDGVAADGSWTTTLPLDQSRGFSFEFGPSN